MGRSEYFSALFIIACVNGLGARVIDTVRSVGWLEATLSTYDTSAIVWVACLVGIRLVLEGHSEKIRRADLVIGMILLIPITVPVGKLSWLAISALSLYIMRSEEPLSPQRRGAVILLAASVPMLWSRLLFQYFANAILNIDASLVGLILGTGSNGNLVPFADGSGSLVILPYCSSVANVSLAFLAWILVSHWQPRRSSVRDFYFCILAACSVVSVNITRIGLMGLSQEAYRAIHSQLGLVITNLVVLGLTLGICLLGVRRETDAYI